MRGENAPIRITLVDPLVPKEVAAELRVHYETVMRWIHSGRLPATKIGREYRIRRLDMERLSAGEWTRTDVALPPMGTEVEARLRVTYCGDEGGWGADWSGPFEWRHLTEDEDA